MLKDIEGKLITGAFSAFLTLAGCYVTSHIAFLKDSPSRQEMKEAITDALKHTPYAQERDALKTTLDMLKENHSLIFAEIRGLRTDITSVKTKVDKVEVLVTRKIGE